MADDLLDIRVRVKGEGVKRALAGITADLKKMEADKAGAAKKADAEIEASAKKTGKARVREVERYVSSVKRAEQSAKRESIARAREILEDFRRSEKRKREEMAKTLRETQMSERRRAQIIRRTEQEIASMRGRAAADAREARSGGAGAARTAGRRRALGAIGGALLGGAAGAMSVAQRAQGALGIQSQEQLVASAIDQRQNFIRTAVQAGFSQQRQDEVLAQASAVSRSSGVSTGEILEGLNLTQELFSNLDSVVENLGSLAETSRATGTEFASLVQFSGEVQRQFGLSAAETEEAIAIVARGAEEGSMAFGDFAEVMAAGFSTFKTARGTTGLDALREQQAIGQALRAGGIDPSTVRDRQSALLSSLSDRQVQRRLRRAGVDVTDDAGNIREISDVINQVRGSRRLQGRDGQLSSTALRSAFGSEQAMQAVTILAEGEAAAAAGRGPSLSDRAAASADAGRNTVDETLRRLNADASGTAINMRASREATVMENSESLINAFAQVAGPLTALQDEFPQLTQAVTALTSVMGGAGAGGLGGSFLGGLFGGGAAGAGAGGTAAGVGGAAALGAVAIPAAVAGVGMTVDSPEGGDMFDFWGDVFRGVPMAQAGQRPNTSAAGETAARPLADEANTRATEANTRATEAAARAMTEAARAIQARAADTGAETPVE